MAGEPQRLVLSIQCWHSGTVTVLMFLSTPRVECVRRSRFRAVLWFQPGPLPPFCKPFRIVDFAVFPWQMPVSKEVICFVLLNHLLTRCVSRAWGLAAWQSASCAEQ